MWKLSTTFRTLIVTSFTQEGNPATVFHELGRKRDSSDTLFTSEDDLHTVALETFEGEMGRLYRTFVCGYYPGLLAQAREILDTAIAAVETYAHEFEGVTDDLTQLRDEADAIHDRLESAASANNSAARTVLNAPSASTQQVAFNSFKTTNETYHATLGEWNTCIQSAHDQLNSLDEAARIATGEITALPEPDFDVYRGHAGQPEAKENEKQGKLKVNTDDLDAAGSTISNIADSMADEIEGFNGLVGCDARQGFHLEKAFNAFESFWHEALNDLQQKVKKLGNAGCHIATEIEQAELGNADRFISLESDLANGAWSTFTKTTENYCHSLTSSPDKFIAESGRIASRVFFPVGVSFDVATTVNDIRNGEDVDIAIISSLAGATAPAIGMGAGALGGATLGSLGGPGRTATGGTAGGALGAAFGGFFSGAVNKSVEYLLERNRYGQWDDLHHKNYVKEQ